MIAALLALLFSLAPSFATDRPAVNTVPPDFTLPGLAGGSVTLSKMRGKVVVVNFFATWCPPCRQETPDLVSLARRYRARGVEIVGIDDKETNALVASWVKANHVPFTVVMDKDGATLGRYDVRGIPTTYVLDRNGVVRYRALDVLNAATLSTVLDAVIAGTPVPKSNSAQQFDTMIAAAKRDMNAALTKAKGLQATDPAGAESAVSVAIDTGKKTLDKIGDVTTASTAFTADTFDAQRAQDDIAVALADAYELRASLRAAKPELANADLEQAALQRGQVAENAEKFDQAQMWYDKAITLAPKDTDAFDGANLAAYERHDYQKALEYALARAAVAPDDPDSWYAVAGGYRELKQIDKALEANRKALALASAAYAADPTAKKKAYQLGRAYLKLARTQLDAGNTKAAEPLLLLASAAAPHTMVQQQADEQYAALAPATIPIALSGPTRTVGKPSTPAALYIILRNPSAQSREVHLAAANIPTHWLLSFCYGNVCAPYKSRLTLAPGASRRVELQVVPQADTAGPWQLTTTSTGESSVRVGVQAKSVSAAITVTAQ